jgi:FMN reductase
VTRTIIGIAGNTHRPSKTLALVRGLVTDAAQRSNATSTVYDLLDVLPDLGASLMRSDASPQLESVLQKVESADALIVGSPVYKGSYAGLFKHLIDLLNPNILLERPILLAATGGGQRHALVVEHQLRPLFGFFGAAIAPLAVYASDADFVNGELVAEDILERCTLASRQLVHIMDSRTPFQVDSAVSRWA